MRFRDLILNSLKCTCLASLLQYRRLVMMACSGDTVCHEPWRKAAVIVAPRSQLLEAFRQIKIIRNGAANPSQTHNLKDQISLFIWVTSLTCPVPSSSYATAAISFRIVLFYGMFCITPIRFTSNFRKFVISLALTLPFL